IPAMGKVPGLSGRTAGRWEGDLPRFARGFFALCLTAHQWADCFERVHECYSPPWVDVNSSSWKHGRSEKSAGSGSTTRLLRTPGRRVIEGRWGAELEPIPRQGSGPVPASGPPCSLSDLDAGEGLQGITHGVLAGFPLNPFGEFHSVCASFPP